MCKLLIKLDGVHVLRLSSLQYLKLQSIINICLLKVILIYTLLVTFAAIVFLFTTNKSINFVSLLIITEFYLSYKFWVNLLVIFCNTIICFRKVHLWPPEASITSTKKIVIQGYIRGRPIFVSKIMPLN